MMIHEKIYTFSSGFKARWCNHHAILHGYLYACPYFSESIRRQIQKEDHKKKAALGISVALVIIFVTLLSIFS